MKADTNENKTALIFGASGLIGNYLVHHLCESRHYREVLSFSRHTISFRHDKLKQIITDLKDVSALKSDLQGHDVFCCLGTTIKKAGNQKNFRKIDFDLPVQLARLSEENKIRGFFVVSSIGANSTSSNFYLRTKGEMEKEVLDCGIPRIAVVRPSMLLGKRNEFRFGEQAGKILMLVFSVFLLGKYRKYRAIEAETVAEALIKIANDDYSDQDIYESDELVEIAKSTKNK